MHLIRCLLLSMPVCLSLMRSISVSVNPPQWILLTRPSTNIKDCLDILLPSITKLVNYSLIEGSFPNSFKKVVVNPLIKKSSLPRNDLKNYRTVSGLCFLWKLVERVIARQLTSHINNNKLDNPHQSAYKPGHSTEAALLLTKNEVHLSLACSEPTALVLFELSAAFDTIDHNILLGYLKSWFFSWWNSSKVVYFLLNKSLPDHQDRLHTVWIKQSHLWRSTRFCCCFHRIQHHLVQLSTSTHILNSIFMWMILSYTSISPIRMPLQLSPS